MYSSTSNYSNKHNKNFPTDIDIDELRLSEDTLSLPSSPNTSFHQEPPSVRELEERKILDGEFSDREILLKKPDEVGFQIFRLNHLEKFSTYITPSGNFLKLIDDNRILVNYTKEISIKRNSEPYSPPPLKKDNSLSKLEKIQIHNSKFNDIINKKKKRKYPFSPILNLKEGSQLDLLKDVVVIDKSVVWNENMTILSNSKLLSESQEEDDGEWLFSPNISKSCTIKTTAFSPKAALDFDLVAEEYPEDFFGTDGILSPPPEEGSMYMDFPSEKENGTKTSSGQNPLFNDDIVRIMSPRSGQTLVETDVHQTSVTTKIPIIITPLTPKSLENDMILKQQKSPSSISSPFKDLDYQPKLFNPTTQESEDMVPNSKQSGQKKKKPVASSKTNNKNSTKSSSYGVSSVKSTNKKTAKNGLGSGKSFINSSSTGSLHKSGKLSTQIKKLQHPEFQDASLSHKERPSLKYLEAAFMEDLRKANSVELVSSDSKEWKLMQWRRSHLKEKNTSAKQQELETTHDIPEVLTKLEPSPVFKKAKSSSLLESPRGDKPKSIMTFKPEKPQKEEPESVPIPNMEGSDVPEKVANTVRQGYEAVFIYGIMDHVPLELCRDVQGSSLFNLGVDIELYDNEQASTPIYTEQSANAYLELVDSSSRNRCRERNRSIDTLSVEEEDCQFQSAYFYINVGSSTKLPEALLERVFPKHTDLKQTSDQKIWFTIRPEMNEFELVSKSVFTQDHTSKMMLIEEFDKSRKMSPSIKYSLVDLFYEILDISPKTPRYPSPDLKARPRPRRASSTGSIMEAVTLPPSPRTPSSVLVDVSERVITPDSEYRRRSLPHTHSRRSTTNISFDADMVSSHSPPKEPSPSKQAVSSSSKGKKLWLRLLKKLCLN